MFDDQVKELYKYLTKKELIESFSIVEVDRESVVRYITNEYTWILAPEDSLLTKDILNSSYTVKDSTNLFFINGINFGDIRNSAMCRKLSKDDQILFNQFTDSCSRKDKDEGMVSLDDDLVYGLIDNDKIVAVSSLWNWGDVISDIGILVHPDYRRLGYAKTVCQTLMSNIDKKFVWRCDEHNQASHNLAISIGFTKYGLIQKLEKS